MTNTLPRQFEETIRDEFKFFPMWADVAIDLLEKMNDGQETYSRRMLRMKFSEREIRAMNFYAQMFPTLMQI